MSCARWHEGRARVQSFRLSGCMWASRATRSGDWLSHYRPTTIPSSPRAWLIAGVTIQSEVRGVTIEPCGAIPSELEGSAMCPYLNNGVRQGSQTAVLHFKCRHCAHERHSTASSLRGLELSKCTSTCMLYYSIMFD